MATLATLTVLVPSYSQNFSVAFYSGPVGVFSRAPITAPNSSVAFYQTPSYSFTQYSVLNRQSDNWG